MSDIDGYSAFVHEYAPLGYARLWARLGDFTRAQQALERMIARSFERWRNRRKEKPQALIAGLAAGAELPQAEPCSPGSFAQSAKLRAIEEARALLRSFPEDEQVALVLLHVEEIPEERALRWLEREPLFLESLRLRLQEKLAAWKPEALRGEEPDAFFRRTLRQYRLSAQFCSSALHGLRAPIERGTMPETLGLTLALGFLGGLFHVFSLGFTRHSYHDDDTVFYISDQGSFGVDLILAVAALLLARYLACDAPSPLAALKARVPLLQAAFALGLIRLGMVALAGLNPREFYDEGRRGLMGYFASLHTVWLAVAVPLVLLTLYRILVPGRPGPEPEDTP